MENIKIICSIIGVIIAALTLYFTQKYRNRIRGEKINEKKQKEREKYIQEGVFRASAEKEIKALKREAKRLKAIIKDNNLNPHLDVDLIQEEKILYVKFIHLIPDNVPPVYFKKIPRLQKTIPVRTETLSYKYNRFNKVNNSLTIRDSSFGVVDLNVIKPWLSKIVDHPSSKQNEGEVSVNLSGSDTYLTASTYYNGIKYKDDEDYALKAEMFTKVARIVVDFSSLKNLDKIFVKEPNAYRFFDPDKKKDNPLKVIESIDKSIYSIEAKDLQMNEMIVLDFHIDWKYLREESKDETTES